MGKTKAAKVANSSKIQISPATSSEVDSALTEWFASAQRPLNFRETRDPYAIMVSEFMLQQTTVTAVEPYFERFMKRFSTVHELASASEDEVMQYWAGLGYYRRARQLRSAAVELVVKMVGVFPTGADELEKLPGFGRYTAGAVSSFAFDLPAPILEANTVRVFSRLAGLDGVVGDGPYMRKLWEVATAFVKAAESPRQFNLAAMELGALVCRPKPRCLTCPVQHVCIAYKRNEQEQIPRPRPRPETKEITLACAVMQNSIGQYLVRRIPEGEWHNGLWEFPTFRINSQIVQSGQIADTLRGQFNVAASQVTSLTTLRYTVTRHKVTCHVFHCHGEIETGKVAFEESETRLYPLDRISELAMGSAQKKLLKLLQNRAAESMME